MSEAPPSLDLRPDHWDIVRDILHRHVPARKVLAFGSRATWTAKDYSDLDLAVLGDEPLPLDVTSALVESFVESDLPFKVDVVDWASASESFRRVIEKDYVVLAEKEDWNRNDEWVECTLADACSSINYGLTASASTDETGPHFLRITDIVSGHIDWQKVPYVAVGDELVSKYQLYDGDIVIARTGASTGASMYVKNPPLALFASYLVRLQAKPEFDARFLSYFLKSKEFWGFIRGVLGDKSAQPNASASTMTAAPLRVPKDKNEQRVIAQILGKLDDKIELNRRMNETLEAMARALFKSWFVDFDPVRAKMEGRDTRLPRHIADLFPDRLVESELGEIPEGWEIRPLDDIATFQNGLALQKYRPIGNEEWLPVVKIADLKNGKASSQEKATSNIRPECIIDDGDIVFSWSGSLIVKIWCGGRAALNQHLFKVTSNKFPKWFIWQYLHSHLEHFRSIAADKATTMGHIKRHHLSEALCSIPDSRLLALSDSLQSTLLDQSISANIQSRTLVALRDLLLPKLISGEIRVREAKKVVDAIA